jgi:hypothetical protein
VRGGEWQTAVAAGPGLEVDQRGVRMPTCVTVSAGKSVISAIGNLLPSATALEASQTETAPGLSVAPPASPIASWQGAAMAGAADAKLCAQACAAKATWHSSKSTAVQTATADRDDLDKRMGSMIAAAAQRSKPAMTALGRRRSAGTQSRYEPVCAE